MADKKRVLVVEDEASVGGFLRHSLEAAGFRVTEAASGQEALLRAPEAPPDLIILDYGLPDISGLEVLKKIRTWSEVPVIFLTARNDEESKVEVLDAGADDYLTKPFGVPELMARVRVALRHREREKGPGLFSAGGLEIDREAHWVRFEKREIKLTGIEFRLLDLLAQNAGKIVSHAQVLNAVWGPNALEHKHYLRVYFGQIRKKIEAVFPGAGQIIENESGVGYRLRV